MEKYEFDKEQLKMLEDFPLAVGIYQFVDKRVVTVALSKGFLEMFDYEDIETAYHDMDNDMYKYDHPDDIARISNAAYKFAAEGGDYDVVYRTKNRKGAGYRIVHARGKHVFTDTGERLAYVSYTDEGLFSGEPKTENGRLNQTLYNALHEESLLKASKYDYLTGLPNMSYFFELAEAGKKRIHKEGREVVFLFMDLVGMKFFNYKYGFAEGDRYLQSFAVVLADVFSNENCGHLGQDHFGAYTGEDMAEEQIARLFEKCSQLNGGEAMPVRVGIYSNAVQEVAVGPACDRAKLACDAIKSSGESRFNYYDNELREEALKKQYVLENFDRAIEEHWIQVYYQPIIRAVNGLVCDEEALARWIDPEKGMLSPAEFIPYVEEAKLIHRLDLYVVEQVLEKIKAQRAAGIYVVPQSVNLSRYDFDACDIVEEIRVRVDAAGIPHDLITVEITESVIGGDFEFMKDQIQNFQELGFPVWMDDFGSGYSSLDILQSVKFDLLKLDMSFMKRINDENGRIILTELVKMATALGLDTVCEGVETEEQVHFLTEIGCSRLQGYYFSRPLPREEILRRFKEKTNKVVFENPDEYDYFQTIGHINLYDFTSIASDGEDIFQNFFNTLPMGIIEIKGDQTRFMRSNQSYRDFVKRFLGFDLSHEGTDFAPYDAPFMNNIVSMCARNDDRSFYSEKLPDGSTVLSFAHRVAVNPVEDTVAVAVAVLSVSEADEGATYADIARALAADYYNIYYIDLATDKFIEYSSPIGEQEMAVERHGIDFFGEVQCAIRMRMHKDDIDNFRKIFTKENIIKELNDQGVFTTTYRLVDTGVPMYVNMKITKMSPDGNRIIMGISIVDSQMKQAEAVEKVRKERDILARVMAVSDDYMSIYTIDKETGNYMQFTSSQDFDSLGAAKTGMDFFEQGRADALMALHPEDQQGFIEALTKENVLEQIRTQGAFRHDYRLMIKGQPKNVSIKIISFYDGDEEKLFAGIRAWKERK